jgi:DNA-binding NarL/FixJ family response regulator
MTVKRNPSSLSAGDVRFELIRNGCRNKQIAQRLRIFTNDGQVTYQEDRWKLRANGRPHAVTIGFRRGLLELE